MTVPCNLLPHSALSPDGSLAAIVVPSKSSRQTVQVYQVSSCSLQLTLTHTSDQSLEGLVFCGDNSTIVGLFGDIEVVIWDLNRGVVAHKLLASDDQSFLALAAAAAATHFYILTRYSQKLYVYEYSTSNNNKMVRKIKSGRYEEDSGRCSLAVSKTHVAVQTAGGGIRIMDLENGQKVGKVKAKNGSTTGRLQLVGDKTLVAVDNAAAVLYNLAGKSQVRVPHDGTEATNRVLAVQQSGSSSYKLLVDSTLYMIEGASFEKLSQLTSTNNQNAVSLFLTPHKLLALVQQKKMGGSCRSHWVDLQGEDDSLPATIDLDKEEEEPSVVDADAKESSSSKRKNTEPVMLGPGQAGMEVPLAKKSKPIKDVEMGIDEDEADGEENDVSIGARLKQLAEALNDEDDDDDDDDDGGAPSQAATSFKAKKATTESLKEFLTQALQSGDDSLLELALGVRDVKIVSTTLKEIDPSLIVVLLGKLTARLASSPMRADQLAMWLSHCLKIGRFQSHHMAPLRNLLYERIEIFSDLLKLEGRLSMMCDIE